MNENNANGTAHLAYHARTFSDQYNNAPPYSPPSTSHTSDTSTTPTISHSNNQDFNGIKSKEFNLEMGIITMSMKVKSMTIMRTKEWITVVPVSFS